MDGHSVRCRNDAMMIRSTCGFNSRGRCPEEALACRLRCMRGLAGSSYTCDSIQPSLTQSHGHMRPCRMTDGLSSRDRGGSIFEFTLLCMCVCSLNSSFLSLLRVNIGHAGLTRATLPAISPLTLQARWICIAVLSSPRFSSNTQPFTRHSKASSIAQTDILVAHIPKPPLSQ